MATEKEKSTQDTSLVVPSDESPISKLEPKQQRFIHMYMTGQYDRNKLAQLFEVHPETISRWLKRKDVKEAIADIQDTTHDMVSVQLKQLTLKASDRLMKLMDSPIDGVALQAVKDVLDRAGHKPKQEIKIDKTVTTVEEKLKNLIDSTIIDAEYEEVEE